MDFLESHAVEPPPPRRERHHTPSWLAAPRGTLPGVVPLELILAGESCGWHDERLDSGFGVRGGSGARWAGAASWWRWRRWRTLEAERMDLATTVTGQIDVCMPMAKGGHRTYPQRHRCPADPGCRRPGPRDLLRRRTIGAGAVIWLARVLWVAHGRSIPPEGQSASKKCNQVVEAGVGVEVGLGPASRVLRTRRAWGRRLRLWPTWRS